MTKERSYLSHDPWGKKAPQGPKGKSFMNVESAPAIALFICGLIILMGAILFVLPQVLTGIADRAIERLESEQPVQTEMMLGRPVEAPYATSKYQCKYYYNDNTPDDRIQICHLTRK